MKKKVILAAAAAVSFSTTAFADEAVPAIYAGIESGYDHVSVKDVASGNGLAYGGVVGVQQKLADVFTFGLEGEVTGATTRRSASDAFGDYLSVKAGRDLAVSLRVGYLVSPNLLVYVKGGYTNARFSIDATDSAGASARLATNANGYRIGTGFEVGRGKLRFRGEYRYSDYSDLKFQGVDTGIETRRQQVLAGVIYGF